MGCLSVIYILLYFPQLTETFVADEVATIDSSHIDTRIISLLAPRSAPIQEVSRQLLGKTSYAPAFLSPEIWVAQLYFIVKSPRLYASLLLKLLRQPYRAQPLPVLSKRIAIFLKAVAAAYSLRDSAIDGLHTHFAWLAGAGTWIVARLLHKPFTVTVHAYDIFSRKNDLLPLVTQEASHVVAVSEYNRSCLLDLGISRKDITTIHCGIDLSFFAQEPRDMSSAATFRILSVGSLVPKKGHATLISACHILQQRGLDFSCTIVGGGTEESRLYELIRLYDLESRVTLAGPCTHTEILSAYRVHDVFVLACTIAPGGDRDGIPVVMMEAGAMGLPLVSTSISGIPELVRAGETGLLVAPDDPQALSTALASLASNPSLRTRLGDNARSLVRREFDIDNSAARLAALFEDSFSDSRTMHSTRAAPTTRKP